MFANRCFANCSPTCSKIRQPFPAHSGSSSWPETWNAWAIMRRISPKWLFSWSKGRIFDTVRPRIHSDADGKCRFGDEFRGSRRNEVFEIRRRQFENLFDQSFPFFLKILQGRNDRDLLALLSSPLFQLGAQHFKIPALAHKLLQGAHLPGTFFGRFTEQGQRRFDDITHLLQRDPHLMQCFFVRRYKTSETPLGLLKLIAARDKNTLDSPLNAAVCE